jgi:hypothetical protein
VLNNSKRLPDDDEREDMFVSDADATVHIVPLAGRRHELSAHCWCHPLQDDKEPTLFIHHLEN